MTSFNGAVSYYLVVIPGWGVVRRYRPLSLYSFSILGASGSINGLNGFVIVNGRCGHLVRLLAYGFRRAGGVAAYPTVRVTYQFVYGCGD